MEGFAQSVKYIVKAGKKGLLQGIVGPVFQLIAAKGEHALAIETALGGAMQNIVAEDEEAAKAAIRQLSRDRAGRATFLPRTSVKGNRLDVRSLSRQAGFVGLPLTWLHTIPVLKGSWPGFLAGWLWRRIWTPLWPSPRGPGISSGWCRWMARWSTQGAPSLGFYGKIRRRPQPPHRN